MALLAIKFITICSWLLGSAQAKPVLVPEPGNVADILLTDLVDVTLNSGVPKDLAGALSTAPIIPTKLTVRQFIQSDRLWLRLEIQNPTNEIKQLVLSNSFPIDSEWLVDPSTQEDATIRKIGSAEADNDPNALEATFNLTVPPGNKTYFIGVHSRGGPYLPAMKLWHKNEYDQVDMTRRALLLIGQGALIAVGCVVLILAIWLRAPMFAYIAISGLLYLPVIGILTGQINILPQAIRLAILSIWPLLSVLSMLFIVKFSTEFIGTDRTQHPVVHAFSRAFTVFSLLCCPLYIINDYLAMTVYAITSASLLLSIQAIALKRCLFSRELYSTMYTICFFPITITTCLVMAEFSGIIAYNRIYADLQYVAITVQAALLLVPIGMRVVRIRENVALLRRHLKGIIADDRIDDVAIAGIEVLRQPVEHYVTILFVDIVGYSLMFERMKSIEAFSELKSMIASLVAIVHHHGGVVDKSLGDGLLAFFGYDLANGAITGHESSALRCARDIQHEAARRCIDPTVAALPLRIGINSATVNIGNVGTEDRFDVTVSGVGVVLASRFETSCEPFKIIIGESTFNGLSDDLRLSTHFSQILVPIKHMGSPKIAFEYNPFAGDSSVATKAMESYRQQNNLMMKQSQSTRVDPLAINTSYGQMHLINYSLGGMCLLSTVHLGRGLQIDIFLDIPANHPDRLWLNPLAAEIAWSALQIDGRIAHGVKFTGRNKEQRQVLLSVIEEMVRNATDAEFQLFDRSA